MAKSPASINLLGKKETTSDTILRWALTTGRFIIIVTETIALAAFAYRFTLDRQIIDLHDKIEQKQAIVSFYKADEEKFRALHTKLDTLAILDAKSDQVNSRTDEIIELATGKVVLESLSIQPTMITLEATTRTTTLMNNFITSLKAHPDVVGISISQIENSTETGLITIALEITIKEKT